MSTTRRVFLRSGAAAAVTGGALPAIARATSGKSLKKFPACPPREHCPISPQPREGVLWRGWPYTAQKDPVNGHPGGGLLLPPLATYGNGPWRTYDSLSNGYALQQQSDGSVIFEVHEGDHPGLTGGDRSGLGMNVSFDGGPPDGTQLVGMPGVTLFYRVELCLPVGINSPRLPDHNNFSEWHGLAGGGSVFKIAPNGAGDHWGVAYQPFVNGVWGHLTWYDLEPLVLGQWRQYILGVVWQPNSSGSFTLWRDGNVVVSRSGVQTMKTFADGSTENVAYDLQLYRSKTDPKGAPIPPSQLQARNVAIGSSYDLVVS